MIPLDVIIGIDFLQQTRFTFDKDVQHIITPHNPHEVKTAKEDFQKITESENQLKKTSKENNDDAHDDSELDLDDDTLMGLDLDDHDDKDDADTNHGAHDDDVDEDGDDEDEDMDQDHDIDDDDNHNTNDADDDDGTHEANEDDVNDVDQDDVAVVDEDRVNEDDVDVNEGDVDDNEDDVDDSHEANCDDDVDNDPKVQNTAETVKHELNQFEHACADQANEKTPKTPAKSAEIPKEQKNNLRKQLVSDIPVEVFEAKKNAEIFGRKITVSYTLSASHPKIRKKRA
ncbi:probable ATP-dependent helicase PF08_0048 [Stegodyphus dumicola]|uniref:probable ATP-dependent helicase PF08_0048 n=1 Tax=Stegodyphus dumicola TaxID=202533 RepID=UPI0015A9E877|nr:probable ATP-dependent helicase PF08_0048 [Stegodyphus dumicola]